jgi:hypothetical protein
VPAFEYKNKRRIYYSMGQNEILGIKIFKTTKREFIPSNKRFKTISVDFLKSFVYNQKEGRHEYEIQ